MLAESFVACDPARGVAPDCAEVEPGPADESDDVPPVAGVEAPELAPPEVPPDDEPPEVPPPELPPPELVEARSESVV